MADAEMRSISRLVFVLLIPVAGCHQPSAPPTQRAPAQTQQKGSIAATSARAPHDSIPQPQTCPAPLSWEDGTPIQGEPACRDQTPVFVLHQGACCRYDASCIAPNGGPTFANRNACEKARTERTELALHPECQPGQLIWRPALCVFASCVEGRFSNARADFANCQQPLHLRLQFDEDSPVLSVENIAQLENWVTMASALAVKRLHVVGRQNPEESPTLQAHEPLRSARARVVLEALAKITKIPTDTQDQGGFDRAVEVTMDPLTEAAGSSEPFVLPWTVCESYAKFHSTMTMAPDDGTVRVEACLNARCARVAFNGALQAAWPGAMASVMDGDISASLSLSPTRQQVIRNLRNPTRQNAGTARFDLSVALRDDGIAADDAFSIRIYRRGIDLVLQWSGQLAFESVRRHPTRQVPLCLRAIQELPPVPRNAQ